jgi:hypothetical protein
LDGFGGAFMVVAEMAFFGDDGANEFFPFRLY